MSSNALANDERSETQRLMTLHSLAILDTERNRAIDGIVKAAAGLCDAPMALVTLVDEHRQWFKAQFGLDDVSETPRAIAFCSYTILGTDVMVVDDPTADERFAENPLVTGDLGLRFYAGAPLIAPNGARLGALCVLDQKRNGLVAVQRKLLARLATSVVELLHEESETRQSRPAPETAEPTSHTHAASIAAQARAVLLEHGPEGFSIRKVADAASVSLSTVQHHFPTRSALVGAIIEDLRASFLQHYAQVLKPIPNPVDRFVACARYILEQGQDHRIMDLLRDLWALAPRDEQIATILAGLYVDSRRFAASMLKQANPELGDDEARLRACSAVSLLSGAFLYADPWVATARVDGFNRHLLASLTRLPFKDY